jgi:hypothetical protein
MVSTRACVGIVGAGQLGSRYLQGLARCMDPLDIWVMDPAPHALATAEARWRDVGGGTSPHRLRFVQRLHTLPHHLDVAIVASSADVRIHIVRELMDICKVRFMLLEKVLVQSVEQLDELGILIAGLEGVWVNHPRRMMNWFEQIGRIVGSPRRIQVSAIDDSWGLATNSLHFIDLVHWWSQEDLLSADGSQLEPQWFTSKRPGFFEVEGKLEMVFTGGSRLLLESRPTSTPPPHVWKMKYSVTTEDGTWWIDEGKGIANGPVGFDPIRGNLVLQSDLTAGLVSGLLDTGRCRLPRFEESACDHRVFLEAMLAHWNRTMSSGDTVVRLT